MDKSTIKFKMDKYNQSIIFYEVWSDGSHTARFALYNTFATDLKLDVPASGWKFFYEHNELLLSFIKSPIGETLETIREDLLKEGIEEL